jgi:hypothetical protein
MKTSFLAIAAILVVFTLISAGCTFLSKPAPVPTPVPTPEIVETTEVPTAIETTAVPTAKPTSDLVPSPTDVLPEIQSVSVSVEKAGTYSTTIITHFNGGKGLMSVAFMNVTVIHPDGTVVTGGLEKPGMGDTLELEGTRGNDRTEVILTMKSGGVYKIYDQLVPYKSRM